MLQGLAFCGLLATVAGLLPIGLPWYIGLLCGCLCFIVLLLFFPWKITVTDTARILDKSLPELEESSSLLLKSEHELGALEKLQVVRITGRLNNIRPRGPLQRKLIIALCLAGAVVVVRMIFRQHRSMAPAIVTAVTVRPIVAGIRTVNVRITPPAYTGRVVRDQQDLNLQVEEGALISWEIQTNVRVKKMGIIFNDSSTVGLKAVNPDSMLWRLSRIGDRSGFYQVKLNETLSDLYKLEVVHDEAPRISIKTPKAYTVVDIGESRRIPLIVKVQDDYGVSDATIVATVATGRGEAVKFKEQVLSFGKAFMQGQTVYDLRQALDLDALGVHPGDELYYYCRARDNHGQESRSDMYIISLPDTAKLMSLEGLATGLDIKPELFRSQRQIIIGTEQLLRDKDTLTTQAFNNKSNDLGIDQKLLRLRYGKFLGEEAEEGGVDESFSAAGGGPGDFGNAAKVRDAFTDKHDNAEDATFFEPAIKQQLKATLTEMWNAELRLRTFRPQEALPYEYKALRLLKDLQQKSRAYVAKTGVRVTPLDMNKRLTGKLDEILEPRRHGIYDKKITDEDKLRMALSILDRASFSGPSMEILLEASRQLGKQAAVHPGEYLAGFQAMKRILADGGDGGGGTSGLEGNRLPAKSTDGQMGNRQPAREADLRLAQQAIRKMVSVPQANPSLRSIAPDAHLSRLYFNYVNEP